MDETDQLVSYHFSSIELRNKAPKDRTMHNTRSIHSGWNKEHSIYNMNMRKELDDIAEIEQEKNWTKQRYQDVLNDLLNGTR